MAVTPADTAAPGSRQIARTSYSLDLLFTIASVVL